MSKTFEKDGETYIVSEGAENIDTETLVDKTILQKVMDRVEKSITNSTAKINKKEEQVEDSTISADRKREIIVMFLFQIEDEEPFGVTGLLQQYSFDKTITYEFVVPATDFIKLPFQLENRNLLKIKSISLVCRDKTVINHDMSTKHVKSFMGQNFDSQGVRCWIEIST